MKMKMTKQKTVTEEKELDRFSSLPDCILLEILSKVDTRSAAQTSVLSKRWVDLWLSLQHLYLDHRFFSSLTTFDKFANQLFTRRRDGSSVLSLKFCRLGHDEEIINGLIRFTALNSVQCLRLGSLDLFETDMVVPSLPSVTSLLLRNVKFDGKADNFNFFSCFPNLEDLSLLDSVVEFHEGGVLEISAPRLAKFTTRNTFFNRIGDLHDCKVVVSSLSLTHFYIESMVPIPFYAKARDPLKEAEVDFYAASGEVEEACLMNLMPGLYSAQSLQLSVGVVQALSKILGSQEQQPSPFWNLRCLKLKEFPGWKRFEVTDLVKDYLLGASPFAKTNILDITHKELLLHEFL